MKKSIWKSGNEISYANEIEMKGFNEKMKNKTKKKPKRGRPNKALYKMRIRLNLI